MIEIYNEPNTYHIEEGEYFESLDLKNEKIIYNFKKFFSHSNRPCAVATRYFSVTGGDARRAALRHASICLLAEGT